MKDSIELKNIDDQLLQTIWKIGFSENSPEWKKWDAPYFDDDYSKFENYDHFCKELSSFFLSDKVKCILINGEPIGVVTMYWENEKTRWLNIGISIYSENNWCKGIGTRSLKVWIKHIFDKFPYLEHIGLTTWSGNERMMRVAEKIGMKKEAQIRKVRYYNGFYYDSVSYGILRDECNNKSFQE